MLQYFDSRNQQVSARAALLVSMWIITRMTPSSLLGIAPLVDKPQRYSRYLHLQRQDLDCRMIYRWTRWSPSRRQLDTLRLSHVEAKPNPLRNDNGSNPPVYSALLVFVAKCRNTLGIPLLTQSRASLTSPVTREGKPPGAGNSQHVVIANSARPPTRPRGALGQHQKVGGRMLHVPQMFLGW